MPTGATRMRGEVGEIPAAVDRLPGEGAGSMRAAAAAARDPAFWVTVARGPVSIVGRGFPVLSLAAADAAEPLAAEVADALAAKDATVFATTAPAGRATRLPSVRTAHPLTDPIALIATSCGMVEQIARGRGIDPDRPRHLGKVTETT